MQATPSSGHGGSKCQYCGCQIEGPVVFCSTCDTPHHKECFMDNGRCTTYACDNTTYVDGKTGQRHSLNTGPSRPRQMPGKGKAAPPPPPESQVNRLGSWMFFTALAAYIMIVFLPKINARIQTGSVPGSEEMYQLAGAISDNNYGKVKRYVVGGTPLHYEWDRILPLHRAALHGHHDMVRLLVKYGAPLNKVGRCGTFLDCARASGDPKMVQLCKDLGGYDVYNPGDRRKQDKNRFWLCNFYNKPKPKSLLKRRAYSLER